MNYYHWWIYEYVINTPWFVWSIIIFILAFNILSPVVLWVTFSGRKLRWKKKLNQQKKKLGNV